MENDGSDVQWNSAQLKEKLELDPAMDQNYNTERKEPDTEQCTPRGSHRVTFVYGGQVRLVATLERLGVGRGLGEASGMLVTLTCLYLDRHDTSTAIL